jgi:hypothetical protein
MKHWMLICLLLLCAAPLRAQDATATPDGSVALPYDAPIAGRLDDTTPRVVYALDGLRGEVVSIRLRATGGSLDPILTVLDSAGVPLAQRDDSLGGRDITLDSVRLPQTQRYFIIVGRFGYALGSTSGAYELLVERIGVSSESGSALRYGDSVINEISSTQPQLYYSFQARRGDLINISMQRISGDLDTYIQVVNSSARVIADNDDVPGSGSLDAALTGLLIEEDGTYVIVASRFGQAAGTSEGAFVLALEEARDSGVGNSFAIPFPLNLGDSIEGELSGEQFAQYYRFEARANDLVTIRMERLSGGVDAFLRLTDASGAELASNDDIEGSQNAAISEFLIPAAGTYVIVATRFQGEEGQTTGRYRLTVESSGNIEDQMPDDVTFIPYGSTITGRIDDEVPSVTFAFFGRAGEVITASINRGDGDLDPVLAILDEAGAEIVRNDDADETTRNARIEGYRLPETGVYYLQAGRYSGTTANPNTRGSFILTFAQRFDE